MLERLADRRARTPGAVASGVLTRSAGAGARPVRDLEFAVLAMGPAGPGQEDRDRPREVGVVRMRGGGEVLREFTTLVYPGVPVPGAVHSGITGGDMLGAPRAEELAAPLAELLSGAVLAAHGLEEAEAFLAAVPGEGGRPARVPGLCTLRALRSQVDLDSYSLPRASHALGGRWPTGQHTALGAARACARLLAEAASAAPGPLYYRGPAPRPLRAPAGAPVRLKPRTSARGDLGRAAEWPPVWRPLELRPGLCGGEFGPEARRAAEQDARDRARRREAAAAAAALTGALAAAAAGRALLRAPLRALR
ncbi:3'-5' exonuclease [Nocardiopsis sp. CNT-189]